jgi:hypothetical protein
VDESAITVPAVARVGAGVPPAHVQRALDVLVARHAALRTVFGRSEEGVLVQHVRPAGALPLTVTEHRTRPRDLPARVLQAGADEPFRLPRGPVAHAQLHRAGAAGGLVVVWLHRVISDLVSVQVLSRELARLLRGYPLDRLGLPMAEVAVTERAVRPTARQHAYWAGVLESADAWLGLQVPARTPHQPGSPGAARAPGQRDRPARLAGRRPPRDRQERAGRRGAGRARRRGGRRNRRARADREQPEPPRPSAAWPTSCRSSSTSVAGRRSVS